MGCTVSLNLGTNQRCPHCGGVVGYKPNYEYDIIYEAPNKRVAGDIIDFARDNLHITNMFETPVELPLNEMIDILTYVGAISQEDARKTLDLKETEDEVWLLCVD
jgi:hypothetical protein